ncbi:hypothetical protein ACEPAH_5800 [Sanghuangporus vaninii]
MAQRPTSAIGTSRPSSSMSRPASAASHRTTSRMSHRPISRLSQRPATRQSRALCQTLVTKLSGLSPGEDGDFEVAYDMAIRRIESTAKQAASPDLLSAQAQLRRFSKKARIQCHEDLAEALDIIIKRFRADTEKRGDLDNEISPSKLAEHLQFLFLLASPPSHSTLEFAEELLDRTKNPSGPSGLTWADILKEEPFEGQHWQGVVGLPPGSVVGQEDPVESYNSSPTLSSISDSELDERGGLFSFHEPEDVTDVSEQVLSPPSSVGTSDRVLAEERVVEFFRLRLELEALQRRQYWKRTWKSDVDMNCVFDLGDPSTLRLSFEKVIGLANGKSRFDGDGQRYINEHDAVREVLISLQGRSSILFEQSTNKNGLPMVATFKGAPKLLHLTPLAQESILAKFAHLSTILHRLRDFLISINRGTEDYPARRREFRTLEAFAEALELQLIRFDASMARREEGMLRAQEQCGRSVVVSLMSLEKALREEFSDCFEELLGIICRCFPGTIWISRVQMLARVRHSPSTFSSQLLDALFDAIQRKQAFGDSVSVSIMMRVFLRTAEPVWSMLGRWLRDGIFMPEPASTVSGQDNLPQEFFIESNGLEVADPDFWTCGYSLRTSFTTEDTSDEYSGVPVFLRSLSDKILGAGKSIGLLRILGHSGEIEYGKLSVNIWPTFETFMMKMLSQGPLFDSPSAEVMDVDISPDNLSLLLSDHVLPVCASAEKAFMNLLYSDCGFLHHLRAIEDLFLSRKGDILADFCDVLFSAIDSKKIWTDYHFLNTALRETVESRRAYWIDLNLVRLSYKSNSRNALQRSVKCFDGLTVEYAAPFPLVFVIGSRASEVYNAILVMLIKIRRAKTFLDNILLRSSKETLRSQSELKSFYAIRSKLSWFVNTFLGFLCSHVLQVETQRFHASLGDSGSLDDIIDLHQKYLGTLEKLCLLDDEEKTAALQRALRSILDMSVSFSDCFVAFAGDTTLNTSQTSTGRRHRHRSRRQHRQRLNVVSFAPISSFRDEDSDSSDSELDESVVQEIVEENVHTYAAPSAYESFSVDDFFDQNEKLAKDLDSRVRYIRREVERLASSKVGSQFDVLAFMLQDWDL